MHSTMSESDLTSLAPSSSSSSPKHHVLYYVQSPSRDSRDGDMSSSIQPSPMESPSHPSSGWHSRNSSFSRFSGIFRPSSSSFCRKVSDQKWNDKGWPECYVIMEDGKYDDDDVEENKAFTGRFQALIALSSFVLLFTVFCFILWSASRPYKPQVTVKSLLVHSFYVGEGSDFSGVPTKMLTINATLRMYIHNPATLFGIYVSSTPINLLYSEITVATGQLKKYYQPRKSHRIVSVTVEGRMVPMYGAGSSLTVSETGIGLPLTLKFEIKSRGNVVGKLVRTKHRKRVSCSLVVDSTGFKPIKFKKNTCTYA